MAMDAGWDEELLKIEMEELQAADFDMGLTGFREDEIADLFAVKEKRNHKDWFPFCYFRNVYSIS